MTLLGFLTLSPEPFPLGGRSGEGKFLEAEPGTQMPLACGVFSGEGAKEQEGRQGCGLSWSPAFGLTVWELSLKEVTP
jgi:hypothetical protein